MSKSKKSPQTTAAHPIEIAVDNAPSASAVARYLGVSRQTFMTMLTSARRGRGTYQTPLRHAVALAQLAGLKPHDLRPDVFRPQWTAKRVRINDDGSVR